MAYRTLGRPAPPEAENQLSLHLENGSRIESLPGKEATVRGFSGVRLIVVDEAARVPMSSMCRSGRCWRRVRGRLLALSTPYGSRGWWYEAWRSERGWERYEIPATEVPRIQRGVQLRRDVPGAAPGGGRAVRGFVTASPRPSAPKWLRAACAASAATDAVGAP